MSEALVPGRIADHVGCLMLKLGQVVFRVMEAELAPLGLRIRHYSILETLQELGPVSQQDLGGRLRIDAATMVASIDDLERLGLVVRERGTVDRRRNAVRVTADGETTLARVTALMEAFDREHFADLTEAQGEALHKLLRKLSEGPTLTSAFDAVRAGDVSRPRIPSG